MIKSLFHVITPHSPLKHPAIVGRYLAVSMSLAVLELAFKHGAVLLVELLAEATSLRVHPLTLVPISTLPLVHSMPLPLIALELPIIKAVFGGQPSMAMHHAITPEALVKGCSPLTKAVTKPIAFPFFVPLSFE